MISGFAQPEADVWYKALLAPAVKQLLMQCTLPSEDLEHEALHICTGGLEITAGVAHPKAPETGHP